MRKVWFAGVLLLALAARGWAQPAAAPAGDPLAMISWIAGDWEAEAKGTAATTSTVKVVNHYHSMLNGKALSVETTFNGAERYRGMIGYDPARKTVAFWYLMTTGESTLGTVSQGDGFALFDFNVTTAAGKSTHAQVHIARMDAEHYRWEFYAGPTMGKLFEIVYKRVK
jgi:hypothetical protein